jgi:hypothetical protein
VFPVYRVTAPTLCLLLWSGCSPSPHTSWSNQLDATSLCHEVNLLDGLDDASSQELRDTYYCINGGGQFDSLALSVEAFTLPNALNEESGIDAARLFNQTLGNAAGLVSALEEGDSLLSDGIWGLDTTALLLELILGLPGPTALAPTLDVSDQDLYPAGLLTPLRDLIPPIVTALTPFDTRENIAALLLDSQTDRWLKTIDTLNSSGVASTEQAFDALLKDAAGLYATSTSLPAHQTPQGLVLSLIDEEFTGIETLADSVVYTLDDPAREDALLSTIRGLDEYQELPAVIDALIWFLNVDLNGAPVQPEYSAMATLIRLTHDTNQPMVCTIDLWLTSFDIELGNLAVSLLSTIASWEDGEPTDSLSVLSSLLDIEIFGFELSQSILEGIAVSGTCPTLTPSVVADIAVIDLLTTTDAVPLLNATVSLLANLERADDFALTDVAQMVDNLHEADLIEPIGPIVGLLGSSPLSDDLLTILLALDAPAEHGLNANQHADLNDLIQLAISAISPDDYGNYAWDIHADGAEALLHEPALWVLIENGARLAQEDNASINQILTARRGANIEIGAPSLRDATATILLDDDFVLPALRLASSQSVALALDPTQPDAVPQFAVTQLRAGIVDDLINFIQSSLSILE